MATRPDEFGPTSSSPNKSTLIRTRHFGAAIIIAWALGFTVLPGLAEEVIPFTAEQVANLGILTAKLEPAQAVPVLSASARVVVPPGQEFVVSAPQGGLVSRIDVAVGDTVQAGDLLAELASEAYVGLQRELLHAVGEHRLADMHLVRDRKLHEVGAIAQRRLQETLVQHDQSAASDSEARQVLAIAGMTDAELERLLKTKKLNNRMAIKSPVGGMVLERLATTGERVDQLAPLFRVADVSRLWLEINLPPERVGLVAVGDTVRIDGDARAARVEAVGRQVSAATHTVEARAELDRGEHNLYPGQTVGVTLQRGGASAFRVPAPALARHENGIYVFVKMPQGFIAVPVELLGQDNGLSVVRGTLAKGNEIAVQGVAAIKAKWTGANSEGGE